MPSLLQHMTCSLLTRAANRLVGTTCAHSKATTGVPPKRVHGGCQGQGVLAGAEGEGNVVVVLMESLSTTLLGPSSWSKQTFYHGTHEW